MFGSTILDVAIGLVFIYCLYSLLATTIKEIIASILGLRARKLEVAIWRMLADTKPRSSSKSTLLSEFYGHPLIKFMNDGGWFKRKPSYISPQNFSKVVVDILASFGKPSEQGTPISISTGLQTLISQKSPAPQAETIRLLQSLLAEANNDLAKFRALLERWFNDMMDRVSGWYKRQSQWIVFVIGFVVAVSLNANTFEIIKQLSKDKTAREQIVQLATNYAKSHPSGVRGSEATCHADSLDVSQRLDSLVLYADSLYKSDIRQSGTILGLGWTSFDDFSHQFGWRSFFGWLITALAISLGAPFWFDLLSKLVQLRGTGPKPDDKQPKQPNQNEEVDVLKRKG
jgi:hypothetical protein